MTGTLPNICKRLSCIKCIAFAIGTLAILIIWIAIYVDCIKGHADDEYALKRFTVIATIIIILFVLM